MIMPVVNFVDGEIENFVYGVEAEGEKEYVKGVRGEEFEDEEFKRVVLVFGLKRVGNNLKVVTKGKI